MFLRSLSGKRATGSLHVGRKRYFKADIHGVRDSYDTSYYPYSRCLPSVGLKRSTQVFPSPSVAITLVDTPGRGRQTNSITDKPPCRSHCSTVELTARACERCMSLQSPPKVILMTSWQNHVLAGNADVAGSQQGIGSTGGGDISSLPLPISGSDSLVPGATSEGDRKSKLEQESSSRSTK